MNTNRTATVTEMQTSRDLKSGDSISCTIPPPPTASPEGQQTPTNRPSPQIMTVTGIP